MEWSDVAPAAPAAPLLVSVASSWEVSGRTSMTVNLAWILAASGRRVLVVDVDETVPNVVDYLSYLPRVRLAEASRRTTRYLLPDGHGRIDVEQSRESKVPRLLAELRGSDYDVVLFDHGTFRDDSRWERVARATDVVVVCFRPVRESVSAVWTTARQVRRMSAGQARVVLVGNELVGPSAREQVDRLAAMVEEGADQGEFEPQGPAAVRVLSVPQHRFTVDTAIGPLMDPPGAQDSPSDAYLAVAEAVVAGSVPRPEVSERVRRRYRALLRLPAAEEPPERLGLLYLSRDRPWAEWVGSVATAAGLEVVMFPVDNRDLPVEPCDELVVITGRVPAHLITPLNDAVDRVRSVGDPHLVSLSVRRDAVAFPVPGAHASLRVGRLGEQAATAALRAAVGLFAGSDRGVPQARFPGSLPQYASALPIRNPAFVGRDADLEMMRDRLAESPYLRWTVSGPPGTGKSELACEYAHRFADSYDLVWWVPAHSRSAVRRTLAALAGQVMTDTAVDPAGAAVAWLQKQEMPWLLIFDNADDPEALAGLVPVSAVGQVVITTRRHPPDDVPGLRLGPFDVRDARYLIQQRLPSLSEPETDSLAALVGHLPVALHLAVAWVLETAEGQVRRGLSQLVATQAAAKELARLVVDHTEPRETELAGSEDLTAAMLAVTLDTMRALGEDLPAQRTAVLLAEMCSFLSPEGVSLRLLCSPAMLVALADESETADWLLQDAALLHHVIWVGHRFGLFEVNRAAEGQVRMHRMISSLVNRRLGPEVHARLQEQTLRALAAGVPTDAEGDAPSRDRELDELAEHVEPSGALSSPDRQVRRWMVVQARYVYRSGDVPGFPAEARRVRELVRRWTQAHGEGDDLCLRLRVQLANLERALGNPREALEHDRAVLSYQRERYGPLHPRTLMTRNGLGGDLWGTGRFLAALNEAQATYEGFLETYGPDQPDTLRARHNMAVSHFLTGDPFRAALEGQATADEWRRVYGPASLNYGRAISVLAMFLRELGQHREADRALLLTMGDMRAAGTLSLRAQLLMINGRALSWRALGNASDAQDEHRKVLDDCRRVLGPRHATTMAVQVALASDEQALGRHQLAVDLLTEAREWFERDLEPGHPFISLCRANLAVALRVAGRHQEAVRVGDEAAAQLQDSLGDTHPWALAATLNLVNHRTVAGVAHAGEQDAREVLARCREYLHPAHPLMAKAELAERLPGQADPATDTLFEIPPLT